MKSVGATASRLHTYELYTNALVVYVCVCVFIYIYIYIYIYTHCQYFIYRNPSTTTESMFKQFYCNIPILYLCHKHLCILQLRISLLTNFILIFKCCYIALYVLNAYIICSKLLLQSQSPSI